MRAKILGQGVPGTWKTGVLAAALDEGYRVILIDLDDNHEVILQHTRMPQNLTVIPFEDEFREVGSEVKVAKTAARAIQRFLLKGNEASGPPESWGPCTILALDNLSSYAKSAMRLSLDENDGKTLEGQHIGLMGDEVEIMVDLLTRAKLKCHCYLICHLDIKGPKAEVAGGKETDLQKQRKREIAELMPTAYYPAMPGVKVATNLPAAFNTSLLFEVDEHKGPRIFSQPVKGYLIKCPVDVGKSPGPTCETFLRILRALTP